MYCKPFCLVSQTVYVGVEGVGVGEAVLRSFELVGRNADREKKYELRRLVYIALKKQLCDVSVPVLLNTSF